MTNPDEKKNGSSKPSLSQRFLQLLRDENAYQDGENGMAAVLEWELKRADNFINDLPETDTFRRNFYKLYQRVLNNQLAEMYGHKIIFNGFYTLAVEIEALRMQPDQQSTKEIDHKVVEGISKIDSAIAKRLAQLLDLKEHEPMYDIGTKPSVKNEQKTEPSFAEPFRKQMLEDLDTIEPLIDDAKRDFREATVHMHEAQRTNAPDLQDAIFHRQFTATRWLLYQQIARSLYRDFALVNKVAQLEGRLAGKSEEASMMMADNAMKMVMERIAKLLAKLFDDSGHDAMYGRGVKS